MYPFYARGVFLTKTKNHIGVLTGGGDCPGLNAAIKWVVKTALDRRLEKDRQISYEVLGIRDGWKGLAFSKTNKVDYIVPLTEEIVRTWDRYGGTNLGTSRYNPFNPKKDTSQLVMDNIQKLGLDTLIAIGGEDTLGVAAQLSRLGVNVIGIPKTIDKDLAGTEYTLGFETAVETITDIVDKLRTTAGSHSRIFVIETMGRSAGWLALKGAESCGAFIALIPEYDFSLDRVNELITEGRKSGTRYEIILVAEGAKPGGYKAITRDNKIDSFGHESLGGIGEYLSNHINESLGLESRCVVLGHIQRGGAPCSYDRRMGRYFGIAAVNLAVRKQFGRMVSLQNGRLTSVSLQEVVGKLSTVDVPTMYDTLRYNGSRRILDA
jgi:ATP-dependent phosphofructokinase / diphosphate-dependent phosphofructokinase